MVEIMLSCALVLDVAANEHHLAQQPQQRGPSLLKSVHFAVQAGWFRGTVAGWLPGMPRSACCIQVVIWFPEFCKSQCISHFAAPFLNVRAKTSVTESVRQFMESTPKESKKTRQKSILGAHVHPCPTTLECCFIHNGINQHSQHEFNVFV